MLRLIAAFTLIVWSNTANACFEPTWYVGKSFEAEVNDNLKHLICLHNEQVTRLNEHATEINRINNLIEGMRHSNANLSTKNNDKVLQELISRYGKLATENQFLKYRVDKLEKQLQELVDINQ